VDLDATWLYSKETYRARVFYAVAYQVYNIIDQVFDTIPTLIPLHSLFRARLRSWDQHTTISTLLPHHCSVDRPTPSRHFLKACSPWLRLTLSHGGRRERLISLSSLSETQERSIADGLAHVSIDQPYTLQRFYITTRSAFLADHRQLG
jgi:hypothetical protein